MCAVAKCKSKKFSLFSTFAVAFSCSFFVAFLSLKTTKKFFDVTNYFPQKRTLWPGQSLSSPIRGRFFWPQMERFVDSNNFQQIFTRPAHFISNFQTWIAHFKLENRSMSWTFQLICIASLLAFSTFILVFMQNCRDCRFSNSETTPMLPLNTKYRKIVKKR